MTTAHSGSGDLNRSLQLLWRGRETSTRGPRPGLTLEAIVAAAVELADREGLAALSMRRVAAELGVGTMSLYRYVPGKGELLDLMLDHVNGPGEEEEEEVHRDKGWRHMLEVVGLGMFDVYRRHPWLLQVNQTRPLLGPNSLRGFDIALSCLDGLGLTGQEKVTVIVTVDAYITGIARSYVLHLQAEEESGISDEEFWAAQAPIIETAMRSGCYPHVFQLDDDSFEVPFEDSMRFGLARLLDGLESYVESRRDRQHT
jgi:AcrR family transcriptional regulator